jgi:hypothetical protein
MIPFLIGLFIWLIIGAIVSGLYNRLAGSRIADYEPTVQLFLMLLWPIDLLQIIYALVGVLK